MNPNPPPRGGGIERDPPELLFSLARLDFFRLKDDMGSLTEPMESSEATDSNDVASVRIGSEDDAFKVILFAFKRGSPEPESNHIVRCNIHQLISAYQQYTQQILSIT